MVKWLVTTDMHTTRQVEEKILTLGAVVPSPAVFADNLSGGGASVVAELVVSWPAQHLATGAVVVRCTRYPIR